MKAAPHFYSLLPHLQTERGHYVVYHRCVQEVVQKLGIGYSALVSDQCNLELPSGWKRWFPKRKGHKYLSVLLRLTQYFKTFLFQEPAVQKRFFFLECFGDLELFLLTFSLLFSCKKTDHLLLFYRYGVCRYLFQGRLVRLFTKLLHLRLGKRFSLLSDSELLIEEWRPLFRLPMTLLPVPHAEVLPQHREPKKGPVTGLVTLWWPGEPREGKGLPEIASLLSVHDDACSEVELIVAASAPLPGVQNGLNIQRIPDILPRSEYNDRFASSDVILLPYDAKIYRTATSGIFIEAIIAGKLPIAKEGNWIARELQRHQLGALILDWQHPKPFSRILQLLRDPSIQEKLALMQQHYASLHSLESFSQALQPLLKELAP